MKKVILIFAAAGAASAWATDLNPGAGRAEGTGLYEDVHPSQVSLRRLWDYGDPCADISWVWANDGVFWNYYNSDHQRYLYAIFKFEKPAGFSQGTLRWRIWGNSGREIDIWRWRYADDRWEWIDGYGGGTNIPLQTFQYIPANWFSADGLLFIMVTVDASFNHWNIISDVCDIQY